MSSWAILREVRSRSGLSQRALASRSGLAQSEIARIECGRQEPGFGRLQHLARSAGFDLRVELVPRSRHDAELIRDVLRASPEERLDSLEGADEFFAGAREVAPGTRRW